MTGTPAAMATRRAEALSPKSAHGFGLGTDKGDAVLGAGVYKVGVFRQQPVAGVNGVGAAFTGDADDFVDAEVSSNRPHAFANAVSLVCFKPVQPQVCPLRQRPRRSFCPSRWLHA